MTERKEYELHIIASDEGGERVYRVVTIGWYADKLSEPREMRTIYRGRDRQKAKRRFGDSKRENPSLKAFDRS